MPERVAAAALVLAATALTLCDGAAAAEMVMEKTYASAAEQVTQVLANAGVQIADNTSIDKLTLIIGSGASGSHVTLTLRSLSDGAQTRVVVGTDSPHDPALEARIIMTLNDRRLD